MAQLNFDVIAFESQQIPEPLPTANDDPFPPDCKLTADQKTQLGLFSGYVGLMDTPAKVIRHWELLNEEHAARAAHEAQERAKAERYDPELRAERIRTKAEHDLVVNQANLAWREAIATRKRILEEQNARVQALHNEFTRLKNLKV